MQKTSKRKSDNSNLTANQKREQQLISLVSSLASRSQFADRLGQSFGTDRDLYKAFGYPKENALKFGNFWNLYKRGDIASRIINAPVEASWRLRPTIEEINKTNSDKTQFEDEWVNLVRDKKVFHYLIRADKLSRIGKKGVLFLGFDDGTEPREPISGKNKLSYLMPFKEDNISIKTWDTDPKSERYSLPIIYELTVFKSGQNQSTSNVSVHYSRVLHLAEGLLEDDVDGTPELEVVYNRFLDLEKVAGGSAEMFFRGAYPGLAFILEKDAKFDSTQSEADFEDQIEKYIHNLQRTLKLEGMDIKNLAPQVSDPSNHVDVIISLIAGAIGFPKRILMGSERGELASSQDETNWSKKIDERRKNYCEPWILREFITKNINAGVLTEPKKGYNVKWPDMIIPTDEERAKVAKTKTEAIATYSNAIGAAEIVPPDVFLEDIMEFDIETIETIKKLIGGDLRKESEDAEEEAKTREELKKEIEMESKKKADLVGKEKKEVNIGNKIFQKHQQEKMESHSMPYV